MQEAVDLHAFQSDGQDDAEDMESLLHWAIGGSCTHHSRTFPHLLSAACTAASCMHTAAAPCGAIETASAICTPAAATLSVVNKAVNVQASWNHVLPCVSSIHCL